MATELRAGRSGIESRWGREVPPVQTERGDHPASCKMGTGSFPGDKVRPGGVLLTTHPLLVPWSRKSRAICLLSLLAVRPVQNLSACTRVTFTFTFLLLNAVHVMAQLVETLRYKPEGRGLDSP